MGLDLYACCAEGHIQTNRPPGGAESAPQEGKEDRREKEKGGVAITGKGGGRRGERRGKWRLKREARKKEGDVRRIKKEDTLNETDEARKVKEMRRGIHDRREDERKEDIGS